MLGTGTPRSWWNGVPAIEAYVTGYMLCSRCAASSCDTSSSSPCLVARIRGSTPSSATAATAPANHGVGSPPAINGARRRVARGAMPPDSACSIRSEDGMIVPRTRKAERGDRSRPSMPGGVDAARRPLGRQCVRDEHVGAMREIVGRGVRRTRSACRRAGTRTARSPAHHDPPERPVGGAVGVRPGARRERHRRPRRRGSSCNTDVDPAAALDDTQAGEQGDDLLGRIHGDSPVPDRSSP